MKTEIEIGRDLWEVLLKDPFWQGAALWFPKTDQGKAAFLRKWADMLDPKGESKPEVAPKRTSRVPAVPTPLEPETRKPAAVVAPKPEVPALSGSGGRTVVNLEYIQTGDIVHYWSKYKGGRRAVGKVRALQPKKKTAAVVPSGKTRAEVVAYDKIERVEREE